MIFFLNRVIKDQLKSRQFDKETGLFVVEQSLFLRFEKIG